ncbi:MAG: hypothetical protein LBF89_12455 [Bacteroidales bacterium]|jgi:hypothetical protein|nr:hypothetical protein [Bacteroidales bacterium]
MIKRNLFFFFFGWLTLFLNAQPPTQFDDPENYPATVNEMFRNIKISETDRAMTEQFAAAWTGDIFTGDEKLQIVHLSGLFLGKKARNIHYYSLWRCLLAFKDPQNSMKGYDTWMKAMIRTATEKKTTPTSLQNLMNAVEALLNRKVLSYSQGNEWRMTNGDFRFDTDNDALSVTCDNIDLFCFTKGDSIMIGGTSGRYNPVSQQWKGHGGTVTWERAGYAASDVYANLRNYVIDMRQPQYGADSVTFYHATYFPQQVQGRLADKVRHNQGPQTAVYPEFHTYGTTCVFENIFPDVSYEGGVTIQGARTVGTGTNEKKAQVRIKKNDSLQLIVRSNSFILRNDRINAYNSSPVFYLGEDSIVHTNVSFAYLAPIREVNFIRSDAASSQAPYIDNYHKTEISCEQVIWKIDEPEISFSISRGSAIGRADFRSQNYFNRNEYEQMQHFDLNHPLVLLKKCVESFGTDEFPVEIYAGYIRKTVEDTRNQIINLAKQGFVAYEREQDYIIIQPKLYTCMNAAAKEEDFDVIDLRSLVNAPAKNAVMQTGSGDITINGVDDIVVSDSKRVVMLPNEKNVILKKNRNMLINGRISAGQMIFYGDSLHFDYDAFKIGLQHADSVIMFVPSDEKDALGNKKMARVKNVIENVSGNILIDRPDNKSGRHKLQEYPILHSDSLSKVSYGASSIEGGAYKNEKFFFRLDPFVVDSLENFNRTHLVLPGKFTSANIFSDMRRYLKVQPDYTLGFTFETGDSAISAYNDAKLSASISLDSKGLRASGTLDFLTASIFTDDFGLYPDSMNVSKAKGITVRKQTEGVQFPEIKSEGNKVHWEPANDKMRIYKTEKPFSMYSVHKFDGNLMLSGKGLSGTGRMDMEIADLRSDSLAFRADALHADRALFRLRVLKEGAYQFVTADTVQAAVDYSTRTGNFTAEDGHALVRFPETRFEAYVDEFSWDMEKTEIRLGSNVPKEAADFKYMTSGESKGTRYISTKYGADSLNFVANSAVYNYSTGKLEAEGVNLLKSGDALIFPNEKKLNVNEKGQVELNENAKILFNDTLKQHLIHSATVSIEGRKKFTASGIYDYVDETDKTVPVEMPNVTTDKSGKTVASGVITEEQGFTISPFYRFQGKMTLMSEKVFPEFEGVAQIVQECESLHSGWFKFKAEVNPADVKIVVSETPVNQQNGKIYNGIFLASDSIYPAFFSQRNNYADKTLIQAHGLLHYNRDSMIYSIAPEGKLHNPDSTGNLLTLNRNRCIVSGEGQLSLGVELGQVELNAVGKIVHNLNNKETALDVMLAVDFPFDAGLAAFIAAKIDSMPDLSGVDLRRPLYVRGLNEWLGIAQAFRFRQESSLGKVRVLPEKLTHTLLLTQLKLTWDPARRSFCSAGKIGIGNLMGNQVNRLVDGFVEISRRPGGDVLDVYLKLSDNKWFYFGYTRELMQVLSSDPDFNDRLTKLPEKQRKSTDKKPGFMYMIASAEKYRQFLAQMNRTETNVPPQESQQMPVSKPPSGTNKEMPVTEIE